MNVLDAYLAGLDGAGGPDYVWISNAAVPRWGISKLSVGREVAELFQQPRFDRRRRAQYEHPVHYPFVKYDSGNPVDDIALPSACGEVDRTCRI